MIPDLMLATAIMVHSDPIDAALDFHESLAATVEQTEAQEQAALERQQAIDRASREQDRQPPAQPQPQSTGSSDLPALLLTIRANESGGNYSAYNATGCEGYGCGGAFQLHALYASEWAARAGFPGMSGQAQNWPPNVQDAVALDLFYSTNPDGLHWCAWTSYC